ncbi:Outer membrane scaffolding protein for murein synthesis, MipA/OmpV family [Cohaesibacter sp. ES.047]|uniref:MipA/OmpV family protein n=1 Tax=Cohaesibacter sp. ES.047 TaxID=1798205 RepID=UPI000BB95A6C|nr:MipA/OmpV family protein [Cohaesibacter sp. ES.047]SNY92133.1 Outer membrane scaffolding protein for murein synthesis, MipA/OmpV family [Cohaesibacter sp. ES.047]
MATNYTTLRARLSCAVPLLMLGTVLPAQADNVYDTLMAGGYSDASYWDISLGGGLFVTPEYEGSEHYKVMPVPFVSIVWNDTLFFDVRKGLGINVFSHNGFKLGTALGYNFGRKEKDSRSELNGLGDIDGGLNAKAFIEYDAGPVKAYSNVTKYFAGSKGVSGEFGIKTFIPLAMVGGADAGAVRPDPNVPGHGMTGPALSLGMSAEWADKVYMKEYYGVTATQSARSGKSVFGAAAGFKALGVEAGLYKPVGPNLLLGTTIKYKRLVGDADKSPVSSTSNQMSGSVFATYSF